MRRIVARSWLRHHSYAQLVDIALDTEAEVVACLRALRAIRPVLAKAAALPLHSSTSPAADQTRAARALRLVDRILQEMRQ